MTVAELIEHLKQFPQDTVVVTVDERFGDPWMVTPQSVSVRRELLVNEAGECHWSGNVFVPKSNAAKFANVVPQDCLVIG